MENKRLVFFGSGPVAAKSLEELAKNFEIEAVVTKPQPAHHKDAFPVLKLAEELKLSVFTVSNKSEVSELIKKSSFTSRLGVLIDFGIIVSQEVIDFFPKGIVNSHFSLLPEWRGADPISFAILSGQKTTGVSLMLLVEKMDEGPIIAFGIQDLDGTETTPELTEKLIHLSNALLKKQIPRYLSDGKLVDQSKISDQIQNYPKEPTYSSKLTKADGLIDWTKPAVQIEREVRAYIEWPRSYTKLGDIEVVITKAHTSPSQSREPGAIIVDEEQKMLMVNTGKDYLCIDKLIPAGKKEMPVEAFLTGYKDKIKV